MKKLILFMSALVLSASFCFSQTSELDQDNEFCFTGLLKTTVICFGRLLEEQVGDQHRPFNGRSMLNTSNLLS